ncbi:alpha/beta hydrolase [Hymenobacter sediminis]|uniref:alpha/beta fold hydrolase n=1 Tax=Hymenobacter sediminis TaxID=2218621 RepID=UPI000DA6B5AE|nr:alpha/beta hydrolase [Hymenobacter sediminis]RPD43740.1 alpha/beta hydrolase [Hymenobacter sediminis]
MKKILFLFSLLGRILTANAQEKLSYLLQTIDVTAYPNCTFEVRGQRLIEDKSKNGGAVAIAVTSHDTKTIKSYFHQDGMDSYKPGVWTAVSASGTIDKQANKLSVGMFFSGRGKYYFDDFELLIQSKGKTVSIPLGNAGFESDSLKPWYIGNYKDRSNVRLTTDKFKSGQHALFIDNSRAESEEYGGNTRLGKYASVNGIRLYYETYGAGEPLLLLHGNNMSIASFSRQIPELAKKYQVIALDSRGQGNSSADSTRLTYELFADDAAAFLDVLGIDSANVLGWSDGGNIGLLLALRHPRKVKKLAAMAAVLYNDNTSISPKLNALLRKQLAEMKSKGITEADMDYRLKNLLLTEPHVQPDALAKVRVPVLVMAGEDDIVKREHTALIARKLPGSTLKIFKNAGHEAPTEVTEEFNRTVMDFFAGRK